MPWSRRLGRLARGRTLLASPPPALARSALRQQHRLARLRVGALECAPPFLEVCGYFAARGAQRQEIVSHAKARRFEQAERTAARALLEARLHRPDFAHRRGELAGDGKL